jgi:hypothetical protein
LGLEASLWLPDEDINYQNLNFLSNKIWRHSGDKKTGINQQKVNLALNPRHGEIGVQI